MIFKITNLLFTKRSTFVNNFQMFIRIMLYFSLNLFNSYFKTKLRSRFSNFRWRILSVYYI